MSWLWIAGPLVIALVFVLTDWRDRRREGEVVRWRERMGDPKRGASVPGPLARLLRAAGGGKQLDCFELVPKLAYVALFGGDVMAGSDHQTVVAKLDESAPAFTVRPLPILDGQREPNTGVQFKKDTEFMDLFIVDRFLDGSEAAPPVPTEAVDKAIRKWLSPTVRAALLDLPDAWLRVEGKSMALTLYGPIDAELLHELVTAADVIFAEHGAEDGPSLFGANDEDEPAAEGAPPKKKAEGGKRAAAGKTA